MADYACVVVSRDDVQASNPAPTLAVLGRLLKDVPSVRRFRERVDITFHGYDLDKRELWEIPEVRNFVYQLDESFPYWLYYLTRYSSGLLAIAYCFLPPFLTEEAQREEWPRRLADLVERRWGPALVDLALKAGWTMRDVDDMLTSAGVYFLEGPRRPSAVSAV